MPPGSLAQPPFDTRVPQELADVDIGVVEEEVGVLTAVLKRLDDVVMDVFEGVIAVDECHVNPRQIQVAIALEELFAGELVMGYDPVDAEAGKMLADMSRIAPEIDPADRLDRTVAKK